MPASLCGALPAGRCRELVSPPPGGFPACLPGGHPFLSSALCPLPRRTPPSGFRPLPLAEAGGGELGHRFLVTSFVDPNPTVALSVICTKYYIFPDPKPTAALSNPTVALSFTFFQNSSSRRVRKGNFGRSSEGSRSR